MQVRSKRYREAAQKVQRGRSYKLPEAVQVLKSFPPAKFDQMVNLAVKLGIDAKKSEHTVRGSFALPHGIGKTRRVIVFADGDEARAAEAKGAVAVGGEDLVKKVQDGWTDFDVAIAVPRMMKVVSRLGKLLGPQGKMPSPKTGTVTQDVATAVAEFGAGKVEFRNDASGNVHVPVGKVSFPPENLQGNVEAFLDHLRSLRPATVKGMFIRNAALSATMSPGVRLEVAG